MIHKIVTTKTKDGKNVYGVIYKDDPKKEVHYLSKEQIISTENGEDLISNFIKVRNEKKKIRSIEEIYGLVLVRDTEWLFAVKFKDSNKVDIVGHRELKKYNIDALLQFYESHIDCLHDQMEAVIQKQKQSQSKQHHSKEQEKPKQHHSQHSSPHKHHQQSSSPHANTK